MKKKSIARDAESVNNLFTVLCQDHPNSELDSQPSLPLALTGSFLKLKCRCQLRNLPDLPYILETDRTSSRNTAEITTGRFAQEETHGGPAPFSILFC